MNGYWASDWMDVKLLNHTCKKAYKTAKQTQKSSFSHCGGRTPKKQSKQKNVDQPSEDESCSVLFSEYQYMVHEEDFFLSYLKESFGTSMHWFVRLSNDHWTFSLCRRDHMKPDDVTSGMTLNQITSLSAVSQSATQITVLFCIFSSTFSHPYRGRFT